MVPPSIPYPRMQGIAHPSPPQLRAAGLPHPHPFPPPPLPSVAHRGPSCVEEGGLTFLFKFQLPLPPAWWQPLLLFQGGLESEEASGLTAGLPGPPKGYWGELDGKGYARDEACHNEQILLRALTSTSRV